MRRGGQLLAGFKGYLIMVGSNAGHTDTPTWFTSGAEREETCVSFLWGLKSGSPSCEWGCRD